MVDEPEDLESINVLEPEPEQQEDEDGMDGEDEQPPKNEDNGLKSIKKDVQQHAFGESVDEGEANV